MKLAFNEIAKACNGSANNSEGYVTSITTDSRKVSPGAAFVALYGPTFDGHGYVAQAAEQGAVCALVEKETKAPEGFPLIRVASTHQALLDLAAYFRYLHAQVKIVAVTGSAGKTTTKDIIASVLSQQYKTQKTKGNFNNHIGMPLTVFQLKPDTEVMVLEMGMNHAGEISVLSRAAAPDIAVITNIGDAHIENLGSRENILKAKLEILEGLPESGVVVLNGDDPLLAPLASGLRERFARVLLPSLKNPESGPVSLSDIVELGIDGTRCRLHINNQFGPLHIPLPGEHMLSNALTAAAVGEALGLSVQQIANGIAAFAPSGDRMAFIEANGLHIVNDIYNANPSSMKAAISMLKGIESTRRVCVLGDMFELGSHAENLHREVGRHAGQQGIDLLVTIGPMAWFIKEGFSSGRKLGRPVPAF
jgi:UDP-N-acetylmuramoyl-tripeptide--D-alanyl-D-alanine ligase